MAPASSSSAAPRLMRGVHHSNPSLPHLDIYSSSSPPHSSTYTVVEDRLAPLSPHPHFGKSSRRVSSNTYSPLAPPRQRKAFSIQALTGSTFAGVKHPSGTASSINLGQYNNSSVDLHATTPSDPLAAGPSSMKRASARPPPPSSFSPPRPAYTSRPMRPSVSTSGSSSSSSASASDDEFPQTPKISSLPPGASMPALPQMHQPMNGKPGLGVNVPVAGIDLPSGRSSPAFDEFEDAREFFDPETVSNYSAYTTPRTFTPQPQTPVHELQQQLAMSSGAATKVNAQQMVPSLSSSSSDDAGSLAGESLRTVSSNGSIPTTPTRLEFINSNFEMLSNPATLDELRNLRQVAKELEFEAQRLWRSHSGKLPSPRVLHRKAVPHFSVTEIDEMQQQQEQAKKRNRKAARMSLMNPVTVQTFSLQVDPLQSSDDEPAVTFAPPSARKGFYGLERGARSVLEFSSRKSSPSNDDPLPTYKPKQALQPPSPVGSDRSAAPSHEALGVGLPPAVPEKDYPSSKSSPVMPPLPPMNNTSGFRKFSRFLNKKKSMPMAAHDDGIEA